MSSRAWVVALCLSAACASKPPPPPVIETQEAEIGRGRTPTAAPVEAEPRGLGQPGVGSAPTPLSTGDAELGAAPQVTLLEAGSEPRRPLRHAFGKGKQLLTMNAKTRVKGANLPLPTIALHAPMEAQIVEVNKAGEARFKFQAGPFKSGGGGGGMAGALGGLMGGGGGGAAPEKIAGWGWLTRRGVMKEFHVEEGATDGDAPVETGDPFPEEAVGVGARWEVSSIVQEKDGPVQQVSVYELSKLDKKTAHTKLTRTQTPVGGDGTATAKSSGELVFRFGDVYPTGRLEMTRNMSLNLPGLEGSAIQLASEVTIGKR